MNVFNGEILLVPSPTHKLEDHPLLSDRFCLSWSIIHTWSPSPASANLGRVVIWFRGTHFTWQWTLRENMYNCSRGLFNVFCYNPPVRSAQKCASFDVDTRFPCRHLNRALAEHELNWYVFMAWYLVKHRDSPISCRCNSTNYKIVFRRWYNKPRRKIVLPAGVKINSLPG